MVMRYLYLRALTLWSRHGGWVDSYYDWYNNKHRHSGICYITPKDCYDGKGEELMANRNRIMEKFYERHSKQKALAEATGKRKYWKMPEKVVVMLFTLEDQRLKTRSEDKSLIVVNGLM